MLHVLFLFDERVSQMPTTPAAPGRLMMLTQVQYEPNRALGLIVLKLEVYLLIGEHVPDAVACQQQELVALLQRQPPHLRTSVSKRSDLWTWTLQWVQSLQRPSQTPVARLQRQPPHLHSPVT